MRIAGYQVLENLFESEKSRVFLAKGEEEDRRLVLKCSMPGATKRVSELLLRNEYDITRPLEGILHPLALEKEGGFLVLIREYAEGIPLGQWLALPGSDLLERLQLAVLLSAALERLHRNNIIHKDLQPNNIIVGPNTDSVTIVDYAISSRIGLKSHYLGNPLRLEGELAYLSPEQTGRMNRVVDYRCDLYSLGIILYELFCGVCPFTSNNPLEMVYSHLARIPEHPSDVNAEIPRPLGDVVLKLLAKNAEDRYQSAACLHDDLTWCLHQWSASSAIPPFEIARQDVPLKFQIPQKLYGRENEHAGLMDTFDQVAAGRKMLLSLSGYSGIGKTALVYDIHLPVTEKRGFFISGKFEQFQRNSPYLGWTQAFDKWVDVLLTEDDAVIRYWRQSICESLGELTGVITDVVPSLEKIIGKQPDPPGLPINESQNRFNYAVRSFIKTICTREHPLVIFLDDCQWSDVASLNLLRVIMTEPGLGYLLIITAYRENEVGETHPLRSCLTEIEQEWLVMNATDAGLTHAPDKLITRHMTLGNLSGTTIGALVADTLRVPETEAEALAQLVKQKTQGNPYFVHRFLESLHEEGIIRIAHEEGRFGWEYHLADIQALQITDNVVDLLTRKFRKLEPETRNVLHIASCIGFHFDIQTMSTIAQLAPDIVEAYLWQAVEEGLVFPIGSEYQILNISGASGLEQYKYSFAHDRVRQAVYMTLPDEAKQNIHVRAGQLLLETLSAEEQDDRIFEIANHLNEAAGQWQDALVKSRVNFIAGVKAKASAAYAPAYNFLLKTIENLPSDSWQADYDDSLRAYNNAAEAAYLSGHFDEMEALLEVILRNAAATLDKVTALEIRTNSLFIRRRINESIEAGLEALAMLGQKLPAHPGQAQVALELIKTKIALRNKTPELLLNLPLMEDAEQRAVMRILANIAPPVFFANPNLFPIILFRMASISAQHGIAASSAYAFSAYAFVLCAITGEIDKGIAFGNMALELSRKHPSPEYQARVLFTVYFFVEHWKKNSADTLQPLKNAYQRSLESGEADFTAFLGNAYSQVAIMNGLDLDEAEKELRIQLQHATQNRQMTAMAFNNIYSQFVLCLQNKAPDPAVLKGEVYDAEAMHAELVRTQNISTLFNQNYYQAQLSLLFGHFDAGLNACNIALANNKSVISVPIAKHIYLIDALVCFHQYETSRTPVLLKRLKADRKALQRYERLCLEEFSGKVKLVEACIAAAGKQVGVALALFHEAAAIFSQWGNVYDQGIGYLEGFRFCQANGFADAATMFLQKAQFAFHRWGADAVVHHLQSRLEAMPAGTGDRTTQVHESLISDSTQHQNIDIYSIIKGAQVISGELDLQPLVNKMLAVMAENAGAERGALLLETNGAYLVEAEMQEGGAVRKVAGVPYETYPAASPAVINYVLHSGEYIVLNDATAEGRFINDPYFREKQVRSCLCMNIVHKGKTTCLLYLENNLVPGAFTTDRIEVLRILGAQAAISIENAKYYREIQDLNKSYERFVPESFLRLLGKASILDIGLGDQAVKDMAVIFSDIWGFTSISEQVSTEEVFGLLNEIWNILTPVIEAHGGIIDKYIGDAVMALFPGKPQDALLAAVEMQQRLRDFNTGREKQGLYPIRMGIGLNTGRMILGTVGSDTRLDTTVIGDAVNVSARLESLTRLVHSNIILTSEMVDKLKDLSRFNLRHIGVLKLRGRAKEIVLYEEFSNDEPALLQQKKDKRELFGNMVKAFTRKEYEPATLLLRQYVALVPEDPVGKYYADLLMEK